jgi:pimeloyl-ACP methyl ester carboxylesterase
MPRILLSVLLCLAAIPALAEEGFVLSKDGVRIAWTLRGGGSPPLVFVHGWSCDQAYWREQVDYFAGHHSVVTVDVGGHGKSGLGREDWTMASFGGDVAAVMEELDLSDAVLIGHSMGGDVIVEAARQARDRVGGLVWVDTYRKLGTVRTDEEIETAMAPFRRDLDGTMRQFIATMFPADADPALVAWVIDDMTAAPREVRLGALQNAISFDRQVPGLLEELALPVLAINPDNQPTDVASMNHYGVEVVVMQGVGHFLMMEDPKRFNALLADAVASFDTTE